MILISSTKELYKNIDLDDKKLIFLSEFCLGDEKLIKKYEKNICPDPWLNPSDKINDLVYLKKKYEYILSSLTKTLNIIHQKNENIRYWEIIVGYWLHEFLGLVFIYYKKLNSCIKKNQDLSHAGNILSKQFLTPKNIDHYSVLSQNELYNYDLCSKILKYIKPNIKFVDYKLNTEKFEANLNYIPKKNIKNILNIFVNLISKFNFGYKQIIFLDESKLSIKQKFHLCYLFKNIPNPNFNFYNPSQNNVDDNLREKLTHKYDKQNDEFTNLILYLIKFYLPISYLENYEEIKKEFLQKGLNCKYIYSANSFFTNDNFKIWASERVKNEAKYILSDHGDSFKKKYYSPDNVIENISDLTIQFSKQQQTKKFFFNPNLLEEKDFKSSKKKILIISLDNSWRPRRASSDLQSYSIFKNVEQIVDLCNLLYVSNKKNFLIKSYKKRGINTSEIYNNLYPKNTSSLPLNKLYKQASLVICTYPTTAFIESLNRKIPTILLYPPNSYFIDEKFDNLTINMLKEGLIYNSSQKCFDFLKKNNFKFDEWWNNKISVNLKSDLNDMFLKSNTIKNLYKRIIQL